MNNTFFLHAALKGEYPKAFVGEPPYEQMGVRAGDDKILRAPLDWVGFHYYTRRIVSDASKEKFQSGGNFSGTEIESNSPGGRDPYTRFRATMPTEGPLTDAGLEVWPRGIYDLVTKTAPAPIPTAGWYRVRHGRVVAVNAFFDARPIASKDA